MIKSKNRGAIMFGMTLGEDKKYVNKICICAIFALTALVSVPNFSLSAEVSKTTAVKAEKTVKKITPKKAAKSSPQAVKSLKDVSVPVVYTMDDCINLALKNSPNIKIYEQKQQVQKSGVGIQKSNYFPSLYGGTGYNLGSNNSSGNYYSNSMNNNYYSLDVGVNALIWDFGRTNAKINMQKFNYEAAGYDLAYQMLQTIYAVKIAYATVLAAQANEDIFRRSVKINQLNYERTKALYEEGLKSRIDVVNAEVYLTNAKIDLLTAQNTYESAKISLNNSMYYPDVPDYRLKNTESFNFERDNSVKNELDVAYVKNDADFSISEGAILTSGIEKRDIIKNYKFKPYTLTLQESIDKAYGNRPDLKSLSLVKRASEESLKAIKKSYMPSINASAQYSMQNGNNMNSNNVGVYAGVDLPTINAMNIKYQIEQGKSYLDIASRNIDLSKKNIYFEVQNYYVNMKLLEKRIPLMSQKIAQTLENFELADGRYTVGLGNFIELQEAQTNYNNAQLAFVQSVFNYNQARFYLERAMGESGYAIPADNSLEKVKTKTKPQGRILPEVKLNNKTKAKEKNK